MSNITRRTQREARRSEKESRDELRERVVEDAIASFTTAITVRAALERSIDFSIMDIDVRRLLRKEVEQLFDAMSECIPPVIRATAEARMVTQTEQIVERTQ